MSVFGDSLVLQCPSAFVVVHRFNRPCAPGSGRRALRELMRRRPCCLAPRLRRAPDGRLRCGGCGRWYSASHSGNLLALAESSGPIGVDVQLDVTRPAALRMLAKMCGLIATTMTHWAAAEATLKALGIASRRPRPEDLALPAAPSPNGDSAVVQPNGSTVVVTTRSWPGAVLAVARLVQVVGDAPDLDRTADRIAAAGERGPHTASKEGDVRGNGSPRPLDSRRRVSLKELMTCLHWAVTAS